jgi:hypothetical protein
MRRLITPQRKRWKFERNRDKSDGDKNQESMTRAAVRNFGGETAKPKVLPRAFETQYERAPWL